LAQAQELPTPKNARTKRGKKKVEGRIAPKVGENKPSQSQSKCKYKCKGRLQKQSTTTKKQQQKQTKIHLFCGLSSMCAGCGHATACGHPAS
jgi:hypothetical protein